MDGADGFHEFVEALGAAVLNFFGAVIRVVFLPAAFVVKYIKKAVASVGIALRSGEKASDGGTHEYKTRRTDTYLRLAPFVAFAVLTAVVCRFSVSRAAVRIDIDGEFIGYVSSEKDYKAARNAAVKRLMCGGTFDGDLPEVTFSLGIADIGGCLSEEELTDILLRHSSGELTEACGIYLNGDFLCAAVNESQAHNAFAEALEELSEGDADGIYAFSDKIEYIPGIYPDTEDCIKTYDEVKRAAKKLPYTVTVTEITDETVGYSSVDIPSRTLNVSTARTILEGVNGTDRVTRLITYSDGKVIASKEISRVAVEEPVAMRRLVGTKLYGLAVITVSSADKLVWPVDGAYNINSDYAYRWGSFHYGIDIGVGTASGTSLGKNVLAAADGVVVLATTHSSYGYYIIIDHGGGMQTVYGHLYQDSFMVSPGEYVTAGQPIAKVGQTGYATGPHLHFEVRVNGNKVDPKLYFQQYKGIGY